jgi:hypothetical protein
MRVLVLFAAGGGRLLRCFAHLFVPQRASDDAIVYVDHFALRVRGRWRFAVCCRRVAAGALFAVLPCGAAGAFPARDDGWAGDIRR